MGVTLFWRAVASLCIPRSLVGVSSTHTASGRGVPYVMPHCVGWPLLHRTRHTCDQKPRCLGLSASGYALLHSVCSRFPFSFHNTEFTLWDGSFNPLSAVLMFSSHPWASPGVGVRRVRMPPMPPPPPDRSPILFALLWVNHSYVFSRRI